ncbi:uncharacterized protein LOC131689062 [Topomyia yanbarensis]|uniref:uncharacterized protein LOC131689062 n=1 Tax=Topomyia yanbarensis TaxID=2498891 RepID=UPI00273C4FCF|nr:uncharacterized protein LOC131689062 [Topomyia yanbarensis]XP_058829817.1 uncharacterized protein LOC131689062 [Topomyia yanbarensis]XP_058829818.1 uncharacterized protein LOC131689062 [Topomyia yanbarensis]XP_058829819.1 uncharacterized protein LOC131689062 [Topomyia yanbarensis]XP_058829822.1 uncharacterized protein LOC131689062 [Topomyia yanbarensis]XP_058829823.1 uncharacterized protein LOC131689062 [Topomyia yanbarensis]
MNKIKTLLHSTSVDSGITSKQRKANRANNNDRLAPEVGFKLILDPGPSGRHSSNGNDRVVDSNNSNNNESSTAAAVAAAANDESSSSHVTVPELKVQLVGARHLPGSFGLKSVEGYMIKVKLFPGAMKFDSSIQTTSWPMFDETFHFPLAASHKSSFRVKKNESNQKPEQTIPEKLFNGNFVVFTVFALLELPPGYTATFKHKTMTFIRQGSQRLKDKPVIGKLVKDVDPPDAKNVDFDQKRNLKKLTTSESQRNIGSVTYFLEPREFKEQCKGRLFTTEEMWLPIKDNTVTQPAESRVAVFQSPKGQVEVTLQLCDYTDVNFDRKPSDEDLSFNIDGPYSPSPSTSPIRRFMKQSSCGSPIPSPSSQKNRFSFKKMVKSVKNKDKNQNGLCLKISTSKIRCGIKAKEEFEAVNEKIYLKTTVLEHEILSATWKSEPFRPTLSTRWNQEDCTIVIPLSSESSLNHISIRVVLAAKNRMGKKVYLGQLFLGPNAASTNSVKQDQWRKMIAYKGSPIDVWHSFE